MNILLTEWTPEKRKKLLAALDEKRKDLDFRALVQAAADLAGFRPSLLKMYEVQDHLERFALIIAVSLEVTE